MVESCEDEFLKFDLEYQQVLSPSLPPIACVYACLLSVSYVQNCYRCFQLAVLQTKTAKAATLDILATHCIPSAMSDDLKTWGWTVCRLITFLILCSPATAPVLFYATSQIEYVGLLRADMLLLFSELDIVNWPAVGDFGTLKFGWWGAASVIVIYFLLVLSSGWYKHEHHLYILWVIWKGKYCFIESNLDL